MDQRAVLDDTYDFEIHMKQSEESDPDPVLSPIVNALFNLYSQPVFAGVIYVMYAPSGQGKTFGARALLERFYAFPGEGKEEHVKGFIHAYWSKS
jgi:hypothetical protein